MGGPVQAKVDTEGVLGMSDTAGDIVDVLLHVELDEELCVGDLVLCPWR